MWKASCKLTGLKIKITDLAQGTFGPLTYGRSDSDRFGRRAESRQVSTGDGQDVRPTVELRDGQDVRRTVELRDGPDVSHMIQARDR